MVRPGSLREILQPSPCLTCLVVYSVNNAILVLDLCMHGLQVACREGVCKEHTGTRSWCMCTAMRGRRQA